MKKMYTTTNQAEAYIVKGILESHNINAEVQDDQLLNMVGATAYAESVLASIWIFDDSQYDKAYKVLQIYENNLKNENLNKWTCSNCQEELEDVFTECWKCNNSREISQ